MFCACVGILFCLFIIITGAAISSIDLVRYDFGLYYILLAVVALMGSLTLCVIRPAKFCGVSDPMWYTNFCEQIHDELVAAKEKRLLEQIQLEAIAVQSEGTTATSSKKAGGTRHQRATLMMLGPAVELMHHVIHGVAERISEEEEERTTEQSPSLWWDSFHQQATKSTRPKRKKKRRPKEESVRRDLYTIPSVPSDLAEKTPCGTQNNASPVYLQMPGYPGADNGNIVCEEGVSEVFL